MARAFSTRKKTFLIVAGGFAIAMAAAGYYWLCDGSPTTVAGTASAETRQPASVKNSEKDNAKRPERATPPPGRFF